MRTYHICYLITTELCTGINIKAENYIHAIVEFMDKYKGKQMAEKKPQQTASELSRTLAGQLSKTEKRAMISRQMSDSKAKTHKAIKDFKQLKHLG